MTHDSSSFSVICSITVRMPLHIAARKKVVSLMLSPYIWLAAGLSFSIASLGTSNCSFSSCLTCSSVITSDPSCESAGSAASSSWLSLIALSLRGASSLLWVE